MYGQTVRHIRLGLNVLIHTRLTGRNSLTLVIIGYNYHVQNMVFNATQVPKAHVAKRYSTDVEQHWQAKWWAAPESSKQRNSSTLFIVWQLDCLATKKLIL